MQFLGYTKEQLRDKNAYWTAIEISHQPDAWQEAFLLAEAARSKIGHKIDTFLQLPGARIILTGAGTSAFIGGCLAPIFKNQIKVRIDAIATTELVANPDNFFEPDVPTLMVSFARSGNSPESLAAARLADLLLHNCFQINITCNSSGALFQYSEVRENAFNILTPKQTNDQSFAMTSSFTSMMLMAGKLFCPHAFKREDVNKVAEFTRQLIATTSDSLAELATHTIERVVYLGSGSLLALAQEAALKLLELTDGHTIAMFDSPLGFRHGPKTVINQNTLIVLMMSSNDYTRQYDIDLLRELRDDKKASHVIALSPQGFEQDLITEADLIGKSLANLGDHLLVFPYIVYAQLFAFHRALALGNSPDSPSKNGTVNRVVQGVTIYPFLSLVNPSNKVSSCS